MPVVAAVPKVPPHEFKKKEKLREELFENRALRRIFGSKKEEVKGNWRKLHNERLHNLYSSPNIIRMIKSRRMRWTRHVARNAEKKKKNAYRLLVGKPAGKRPPGRTRRRSVDNVKMDLIRTG
jgi:hypothetical protein